MSDVADSRLRVSALTIQPELVWDDGTSLSPGPQLNPFRVGLAEVAKLPETILNQIQALSEQIQEQAAKEQG